MANLSALNKIMRMQKLLLPLNAHNGALACNSSSHASTVQFLQIQRTTLPQRQSGGISHRIQRHRSSSAPLNSSAVAATSTTINEFRSREEKREEEFARQQEAEEKQKADDEEKLKRAKVDAIRMKILESALPHVPTLGWTRQAIVQGAEDADLPSVVHGMFPEGGFALVSHFNGKCNEQLLQQMQAETAMGTKEVDDHVDFLVRAVRSRLEMITPFKGQWPQAMALIALPQNASTALAQVLTLVDDICYYSGDRSVDVGWYTRRIGLATIMKMTELYMLQDKSPQHVDTWKFLKNRMDEAVQLQMMLLQTEDMTHKFQRSFNSAFITARNILGLSYNRN